MGQNEMSQVSLLDEIKENASLIKALITKAEENKHDKELVDNCVVAMKSGESGKAGSDADKVFENISKDRINSVIDSAISSIGSKMTTGDFLKSIVGSSYVESMIEDSAKKLSSILGDSLENIVADIFK